MEIFFVWFGIYFLWQGINKLKFDNTKIINEFIYSSIFFAFGYLTKPEGLLFWMVGLLFICIYSLSYKNILIKNSVKSLLVMTFTFLLFVSPYWLIQINNTGSFSLSGKGLTAIAYGLIINQGGNIEKSIYDGTREILQDQINNVGMLNYILSNKFIFIKHMVKNAEREISLLFSLGVFPVYYLPFIGIGLFKEKWNKERLFKELFLLSMFLPMIVNIPFWIGERHLIIFVPIFIIWLSRSISYLWDWYNSSAYNIVNKKLVNFISILFIIILFIVPFLRFDLVRTKPYAIKNVASWMNNNVSEGEGVYSIKGHYLDLYTLYKYKVGTLEYDLSLNELYAQAIKNGYKWLLIEDMLTFNQHPELRSIFNSKRTPSWLELKFDAEESGHRAKLYKIIYD